MDKYLNKFILYQLDAQSWDNVLEEISSISNLSKWGINLLKDLKYSVKAILLEEKYICKDYKNIYSNYVTKKFDVPIHYTNRLHFFNSNNFNLNDIYFKNTELNEFYVGYSVLTPNSERCIGRTIIDPYKLSHLNLNNFYCLRTEYKVNINGAQYRVKGFPYLAQTTDVTVCAHSALWIICRYLSERYSIYPEIYPFDIVRMTDNYNGRTFPYRGMTYTDYSNILTKFGTFPVILRMKDKVKDENIIHDKFEDLYSYIESGFPVLASVHGHVNSVIGHTIDYNKKVKPKFDKNFISSSQFISSFIVNDDNFFPYQELKYDKIKGAKNDNSKLGIHYSIDSIYTVVCPLPEKVFLPADLARIWIKKFISSEESIKNLSKFTKGPWVIRIFLTTNTSLKKRKIEYAKNKPKQNQFTEFITNLFLPHFIWIAQISTIEQYKNNVCTAEVVIDSTASKKDLPLIYARFGNILYYCEKLITLENDSPDFEMYTHNLGERT